MADDDEAVPRLPRGRGIKLSRQQLFRVAITAMALVVVLVVQKPCANAVSTFVTSFDDQGSTRTMPKPGAVDRPTAAPDLGSAGDYETLSENLTQAEYRALVERQKAKQAARRAAPPPATGSAAPEPRPAVGGGAP